MPPTVLKLCALTMLVILSTGCTKNLNDGKEKGACYGNGTCNDGLTCLSELCVRAEPAQPTILAQVQAFVDSGCACKDKACFEAVESEAKADIEKDDLDRLKEDERDAMEPLMLKWAKCEENFESAEMRVHSVSPSEGPADGGGLVSIHGIGFEVASNGGVSVYFGDKKAMFMRFDGGEMMLVRAPPGDGDKTVDVEVIFGDGREHTLEDAYTYVASAVKPSVGSGVLDVIKAMPPQVQIGETSITGDLDKNIIRRYIRRKLPRIRHCYEKELLIKPTLAGTVVTNFRIAPSGSVASVKADGIGNPTVETCVAAAIKSIGFPKPKGGGYVNVRYPFTFQPAQ